MRVSEQPNVRPVAPSGRKFSLLEGPPTVIGVDLDNVCFEHTRSIRPFALEWIRANHPGRENIALHDLAEDAGWFMPEWGISQADFFAIEAYAIEHQFFRHATPMEGAAQALQQLAGAGFTIRYVTARPVHLDSVEQTKAALAAHGFPAATDVHFVGDDRDVKLKSHFNCAVYIDDSVSNIVEFANFGHRHIIFDHVYNRSFDERYPHHADTFRVTHWNQVPAMLDQVLGLRQMPVDRTIAMLTASDELSGLEKRLADANHTITTLTEQLHANLPGRKQRDIRAARIAEITSWEATRARIEWQLNAVAKRYASLAEDVRSHDEFVRENPEFLASPTKRDLDRELQRITVQRQEIDAARAGMADDEDRLAVLSADLDRRALEIEEAEAALHIWRTTLGLEPGTELRKTNDLGIKETTLSYGEFSQQMPELSPILDLIAMRTARFKVESQGFRVIGERVKVKHGQTETDIDVLAVRGGVEGDLLARERSNILEAISERQAADAGSIQGLEQQLRQIERKLFLSVEVKWGGGRLSPAQKEVYRHLGEGGTVVIDPKRPEEVTANGLAPGVPFASGAEVIRVQQRELEVLLKALKDRDAIGHDRSPAEEVIELTATADHSPANASEASAESDELISKLEPVHIAFERRSIQRVREASTGVGNDHGSTGR